MILSLSKVELAGGFICSCILPYWFTLSSKIKLYQNLSIAHSNSNVGLTGMGLAIRIFGSYLGDILQNILVNILQNILGFLVSW